ncbi:preprotein translocase subunit SecY, partial [candidate division MSBL1 archaeon SCGC-AAA261F19]
VIYAESMRVEIPLAYSRFGGMRGRYPIKFIYASVIPVILSLVLFTNVRILALVTGFPFLGTFSGTAPVGGLYYYLSPPTGISGVLADPIRAVVYMVILMGTCMVFAWLWVQMTNMGPRDVAQQLKRSGMSIPGFRRDTRVIERYLGRYITPVTLLGGATVGALAAGANFLGALSSGTGILLTVSIIYRLYQEIARERVAEMFPAARSLLGE